MSKGRKWLSVLLAGVLLISQAVPAGAADIGEAERKAKKLEQQKKEAEADKASLKVQLETIVADMKESEKKMSAKEAEIERAEEDLLAAKVEENKQYNGMKKRIKHMYENGNSDYLEVFMAAKNISDLLNKAEYITKISEFDRDMLKKYQKLVKEVEDKEKKLKKEYEELGALQEKLAEDQKKVETLLKEKSSELDSIKSQMKDVETLIANAKEAERRRQEALESQRPKPNRPGGGSSSGSAGGSVISGNGFFTHPCPGMTRKTSYFGEVRQGIGDTRPHSGNDYAAPAGTPIYAAAAGRVLIAGYSNSAGNWVVIDHGNGLTTKYMHMYRAPYVSAGQMVSKGQNIGGVGTTGQSFGNHLHFQVELHGTPVNPDNYL